MFSMTYKAGADSPGPAAVSLYLGRVWFGAQSILTMQLMPVLMPLLQQLGPLFCNFGFVELHSCRVAKGGTGVAFVRMLADALRAPVRAGLSKQSTINVFTLTGQASTGFPNGRELVDRALSRQESVHKLSLRP